MSERKKLGYRISAVFAALALAGLAALVAGCGGGGGDDEAAAKRRGGYQAPPPRVRTATQTAAPAGAAPAAAFPAATPAAGGGLAAAAGAAAVPAGPSGPALPTEEVKAERLAAFASKYGAVTQTKVKDWDGREIEFVNFTHQGQKISLPLSMVAEAADPEALEGYFKIYPASAVPRKPASAKQVLASGGDEDEEEATAEEPATEADASG